MEVRRVVTGHDASGKSVFVSDERVPPVTLQLVPAAEFHSLWGADVTVSLPTDGRQPPVSGYFPNVGGFRFLFFSIRP